VRGLAGAGAASGEARDHLLGERAHGVGLAAVGDDAAPLEVQNAALWAKVNSLGADFGEQRLGPGYLRLRFEELCAPEVLGRTFLRFAAGREPDEGQVAAAGPLDEESSIDCERSGRLDSAHGNALRNI